MEKRGVVLLSGGLDSAVTLAWAVAQGYDMHALFFDYGQPAAVQEERASRKIASRLGAVTFHSMRLCKEMFNLPDKDTMEFPVRNLNFISAAAAIAMSRQRPKVFIGIISSEGPESEGCVYPDCQPDFLEAANVTLQFCHPDLELLAPLSRVTKSGVYGLAGAMGVDVSWTFSCLTPDDEGKPCGTCVSCIEAAEAQRIHEGVTE